MLSLRLLTPRSESHGIGLSYQCLWICSPLCAHQPPGNRQHLTVDSPSCIKATAERARSTDGRVQQSARFRHKGGNGP